MYRTSKYSIFITRLIAILAVFALAPFLTNAAEDGIEEKVARLEQELRAMKADAAVTLPLLLAIS